MARLGLRRATVVTRARLAAGIVASLLGQTAAAHMGCSVGPQSRRRRDQWEKRT